MCPEAGLGGQTLLSLPCWSEHELADSRTPGEEGGPALPCPLPSSGPIRTLLQSKPSSQACGFREGRKKKPLSDSSFRFRVNWSGWGLGVPSGENSFSGASQMGLSWRSGQRVGPLISTALNPLCSCIQCLSFAGTTVDTQGPPDAR